MSDSKTGVYFWSDLHYGHAKAAHSRGFVDVLAHNRYINQTLMPYFNKQTTVWLLGDIWRVGPLQSLAMSLRDIKATL